MRQKSYKSSRTNSDIQRVISYVLEFEMKDPRVNSFVSVVKTEATKDLKECKCYVSVLGSEDEQRRTMLGLKSASGFIRSRLAESLNLRNTPEITFILDHSIEYGVEMSKKIDDIIEQDRKGQEKSGNLNVNDETDSFDE